LPVWTFRKDLGRTQPLILTVVPFHQVRIGSAAAPNPASSQVRTARCKGLVNTLANVMLFRRSPSRRALRSPFEVNGKSVRPVCCPERLHAVSPCRARYTAGSASLMQSLTLERSTRLPPFPGSLEFSGVVLPCQPPNQYLDVSQAFKVPHQSGRKRGTASPQYQNLTPPVTRAPGRRSAHLMIEKE
jgi:hypothetical protein